MTRSSTAIPLALSAALGLAVDQLFGEPSNTLHPVVHFGRIMGWVERRTYRDAKAPGAAYALSGLLLGSSAGAALRSNTLANGLSVGARALRNSATDIATALQRGDLDTARTLLPTLVGRDPSGLDANEIARAVVESVAENTVDAVVAPTLYASLFGARGALGYRAVNTMDAMVGHRSPRYANYGWASARLDDAANWIPARCTALLVALVRPHVSREIRLAVSTQAPSHPSPNSGVAEAAFAGALGVRLGGRNVYAGLVEERPTLGDGPVTEAGDIERAVRLSRDVTVALASLLAMLSVVQWWFA